MTSRVMALTPQLLARCHRVIEDTGPEPGLAYLDDADYEVMLDKTLAAYRVGEPVWLFAYGSLIWKPELEHLDERLALVRGWHRSFCIRLTRWRGTLDRPGLMMGLHRGGQCRGIAYRLPEQNLRDQFDKLFRREMTAKPSTYLPRWLKLETAEGPMRALSFVVNPKGRTFAGKRGEDEVAQLLADACGHLGSGADYLYHTVKNLETHGIHDRHLWRLQQLVANILADGSERA